jgi:hypothetical protein
VIQRSSTCQPCQKMLLCCFHRHAECQLRVTVHCAYVINSNLCAAIILPFAAGRSCLCHPHADTCITCYLHFYSIQGAARCAVSAWYLHSYDHLFTANEEPHELFLSLIWALHIVCRGRHAPTVPAHSAARCMLSGLLSLSAVSSELLQFKGHDVPTAGCCSSCSLHLAMQCGSAIGHLAVGSSVFVGTRSSMPGNSAVVHMTGLHAI